jgi:peroxiredoxin Q/BCP
VKSSTAAPPAIGRVVPDFTLPASGGEDWSLKDARGSNVVIYFYPKDDTPGCTLEGENFRDLHAAFAKAKTQVVGISPDSVASHDRFCAKKGFRFPLLSDADRKVCALFGVWREKSMYGRKYMGVERSTFLVDAQGKLRREWRKVKVNGHAAEVLAAARELQRA